MNHHSIFSNMDPLIDAIVIAVPVAVVYAFMCALGDLDKLKKEQNRLLIRIYQLNHKIAELKPESSSDCEDFS